MDITSKAIPFASVDCSGNELVYVQDVLGSGWLTTGKWVERLEQEFANHIGCKHALAVNSCTSALHLALDAVGVREGDKVLVPAMTFASTVEVICYQRAVPILMDVDPNTSALSGAIMKKALAEHPDAKAMIVVHYGGQCVPMLGEDGAVALCRKAGVKLIEDAAHAFPAKENDQYVGTLADATCFSFYANKTITTGEGGMLTCRSDAIAKRARLMRLHGIDRDVWTRFTHTRTIRGWEYDVTAPGYKYNMADINAAIGVAQLERAETMRNQRQTIAAKYDVAFKNHEYLEALDCRVQPDEHAWHLYPIKLKDGCANKRDALIDFLSKAGIGTSVHYKPIHRLSYYNRLLNVTDDEFANSDMLWNSSISLPLYHTLNEPAVRKIIQTVMAGCEALYPTAVVS